MELHRLKPMQDYDPVIFNDIYTKVQPLIKKLVRDISPRAVGYPSDIIESWFHDKVIFVFNRYVEEDPNIIKAKVINSLGNFRNRILKKAYQERTENNVISMGEDNELENILVADEEDSTKDILLKLVFEFMKKNLTDDAYLVFELETNPPEYIKERMKSKVSGRILAEYLGLPDTSTSIKFINELRDEVRQVKLEARLFFEKQPHIAYS